MARGQRGLLSRISLRLTALVLSLLPLLLWWMIPVDPSRPTSSEKESLVYGVYAAELVYGVYAAELLLMCTAKWVYWRTLSNTQTVPDHAELFRGYVFLLASATTLCVLWISAMLIGRGDYGDFSAGNG